MSTIRIVPPSRMRRTVLTVISGAGALVDVVALVVVAGTGPLTEPL